MRRFTMGLMLALTVCGLAGTAMADPIQTQDSLSNVYWGTRSERILFQPLLLKLDRLAHPTVADAAALAAVPAADRYHGMTVALIGGAGSQPRLYVFHGTATTAGDNVRVVAPGAGNGRWFRVDDIADGSITLADLGVNGCTAGQAPIMNPGGTAWACGTPSGGVAPVSPSVTGNVVSFSGITGQQADSGFSAAAVVTSPVHGNDGNLPVYTGNTTISDYITVNNAPYRVSLANVVTAAAAGFDGHIAVFDGATKGIKDGGAAPTNGADGTTPTLYSGTTMPAPSLGVNGDLYIMAATADGYQVGDLLHNNHGAWSQSANIQGPQGGQGPVGAPGPMGGAAQRFGFSSVTHANGEDPVSTGTLRLNGNLSSATIAWISIANSNGDSVAAWLNLTLSNGGLMTIAHATDPAVWATYRVGTTVADHGSYLELALTPIASHYALNTSDPIDVGIVVNGAPGAKGDDGAPGAPGGTGNDHVKLTPDGGLANRMINGTGGASVLGTVVRLKGLAGLVVAGDVGGKYGGHAFSAWALDGLTPDTAYYWGVTRTHTGTVMDPFLFTFVIATDSAGVNPVAGFTAVDPLVTSPIPIVAVGDSGVSGTVVLATSPASTAQPIDAYHTVVDHPGSPAKAVESLPLGYDTSPHGIVLDAGVANGDPLWVIFHGEARALLEDGQACLAGQGLNMSSSVPGRLKVAADYPIYFSLEAVEAGTGVTVLVQLP